MCSWLIQKESYCHALLTFEIGPRDASVNAALCLSLSLQRAVLQEENGKEKYLA